MITLSIDIMAKMEKLIEIQQERQKAMEELSQILGIDISFSEEEIETICTRRISKILR